MEEIRQRWESIAHQYRLVGILSAFFLTVAVAIMARPDTVESIFWQQQLGVESDAMFFLFVGSAFWTPLAYYLYRHLIAIVLASAPSLIFTSLLTQQAFITDDVSLIYLTYVVGFLALVIFSFYLASELEGERAASQRIDEENAKFRERDNAKIEERNR